MKLVMVAAIVCFVGAAIVLIIRNRSSDRAPSAVPKGHSENESWVVNRGGEVVEKKAQIGMEKLSAWERLVYCLWVTDYMMRNAGDFANAEAMYPDFQADAKKFAKELSLSASYEAFSLSRSGLQREYFERFEAICNEIKGAELATAPNAAAPHR